jgi:hypothetical protein
MIKYSRKVQKNLKLLASILLLCAFVNTVPRIVKSVNIIKAFYAEIEEQNIDASSLFYTEEEKTSIAEEQISKDIKSD